MVEGKSIVMLHEPDEGPVVFWNIFERRDYLMAPKVHFPLFLVAEECSHFLVRRRWYFNWTLIAMPMICPLASTEDPTRLLEPSLSKAGT
jgi:hypothetical protein